MINGSVPSGASFMKPMMSLVRWLKISRVGISVFGSYTVTVSPPQHPHPNHDEWLIGIVCRPRHPLRNVINARVRSSEYFSGGITVVLKYCVICPVKDRVHSI